MASEDPGTSQARLSSSSLDKPQVPTEPRQRFSKHIQFSNPDRPWELRSHPQTPFRSCRSSGAVTPNSHWSPRASVSSVSLQHLLEKLELDQYDTYGVEEHRDGFFDATFFRPLHRRADLVPSGTFSTRSLSSHLSEVAHGMITDIIGFVWTVFTTYKGINVAKSLLAYLICYYLCLIPSVQRWFGVHSYFAVISVLLNHPGRSFGAQLDGLMLCTVGAAVGMIWGGLALGLAHQINYTGVREVLLEVFLVIFATIMAGLRSTLVRLYQALMSAGLAVFFMCLVSTDRGGWDRNKISEFAVPFLAGQVICLAVNILILPETGGRGVAVALHNALLLSYESLHLPRESTLDIHRNLNMQLVNLSEAFRDMRMEIIISRYIPDDIRRLRNTLQTIIRNLMAIDPATKLFDAPTPSISRHSSPPSREDGNAHIIIDIDTPAHELPNPLSELQLSALELVRNTLAPPARELIHSMRQALAICDMELMKIGGYHNFFTSSSIACDSSLLVTQEQLRISIGAFDDSDFKLVDHPFLPHSYSKHPELVHIFLFIHPLRQAAGAIVDLIQQVVDIRSAQNARDMKFSFPSYPWKKSLHRTSPQVMHDRGGVTANYYFRSKTEVDGILQIRKQNNLATAENISGSAIAYEHTTTRYRIWKVIHRLQGFEARFAIKMAIVTTLLSLPICLGVNQKWYNNNSSWWSVMTAWFMMHPRVGGNAKDLIVRTISAAVGAAWGGLAYISSKGNPFIMAAFATVYMLPALYRLTTSSHPRSGLMACLSFSVISLSAYNNHGFPSAIHIAWTRGTAMVVGICAAVVVNWCIWPFVARHELRKALSAMMLNLAITYSGIVARYIYPDESVALTVEDIEKSDMLDAKLREMFVRIRELLEMTTHEIRLRAPFNPTPYSALIDTLERFFEHLVQARQSSLYFQPNTVTDTEEQTRSLLSCRRDAVASIIMNLYTMAAALRVQEPVPKYLPSAAVARKRLLDQMEESELETEEMRMQKRTGQNDENHRRWADVYQFAYSSALTDIVGQLEELEASTKEICGEMALDVTKL